MRARTRAPPEPAAARVPVGRALRDGIGERCARKRSSVPRCRDRRRRVAPNPDAGKATIFTPSREGVGRDHPEDGFSASRACSADSGPAVVPRATRPDAVRPEPPPAAASPGYPVLQTMSCPGRRHADRPGAFAETAPDSPPPRLPAESPAGQGMPGFRPRQDGKEDHAPCAHVRLCRSSGDRARGRRCARADPMDRGRHVRAALPRRALAAATRRSIEERVARADIVDPGIPAPSPAVSARA